MSEKNLKVVYMINGLMVIGEVVPTNQKVSIKAALGLAPGNQQGQLSMMEAFPFTPLDAVVELEPGSFIAVTDVGDKKLIDTYQDAISHIRAQKSGLVLP
jgi:hypothetical protein